MSGNGGNNAHGNAFGGGRNPGVGGNHGGDRGSTGGYDGKNLGGHTRDNGDGTSTTTDHRGSITHYGGRERPDAGWSRGGNGGDKDHASSGVNLSLFPEAQANVAYGVSMNISLIDGMWGFSLFRTAPVQKALLDAMAKLEQGLVAGLPYAGRLMGVTFGVLIPSEIAKDDPNMMSQIMTSLPADKVLDAPLAPSLPLQPATVRVKNRVADIIQDEKQKLAVVAGVPMSVPVVEAKPTSRPGVFTASIVPGKPDIHLSIKNNTPVSVSQPKGIPTERGDEKPVGFSAGGNTHDAVIRFPDNSNVKPVYVSVSDVLTPEQVKQREEEERRRQQMWNASYPLEAAKHDLAIANDELRRAGDNVTSQQRELERVRNEPDVKSWNDPSKYPIVSEGTVPFKTSYYSGTIRTVGQINTIQDRDKLISQGAQAFGWDFNEGNPDKDSREASRQALEGQLIEYGKIRNRLIVARDKLTSAEQTLSHALESRREKEGKKKAAENKVNEEKKKPRKGLKDYGHDYYPDPETKDIHGLGELQEGKPKTPKQNGGGKRARWYGDKGRKIYDWDSRHGELEGYRASDGEHLGSFDHKTGKQLKSPDPKRNIKKYL
ncbi:colicin-like bacteriocin tRNase domain-containing protein (plasmid) [Edwardsiella tarda]|uniref:colicin-like bacteriocin tRNase domain-containing protein n=1 Tax=Edwardsiella tarda TaxID=636 RepID=UPI00244485DC|nr:colicin-like bacteriocin tRNase domain-containing protein [Edwardsiella tarda]WGE30936.1 colicin-like bacteriocin tRNase domain-containing protein [Edwardsiella tarda]